MPKRRKPEKDVEYVLKKLKRLKKKLKHSERERQDHEVSSDDDNNEIRNKDVPLDDPETIIIECEEEITPITNNCNSTNVSPNVLTANLPVCEDTCIPGPNTEPTILELDPLILNILGEDPSTTQVCGKDINKDIVVRFEHISCNGMTKEQRKELINRYLIPNNCQNIDAPCLNPEIRAALSEVTIKRDKGIELKQKLTASAISGIGEALTLILSKENTDPELLKILMDTGRILCDEQYTDSITRRNFILSSLKKDATKELIHKSKIDKYLFGKDLSETLKTAKAINKSGAELRYNPNLKSISQPKKTKPSGIPTNRNLNWRIPPSSRRPQGNQRTREPALPRNQPATSYKVSQPVFNRPKR